jgi:glycosyltransferase involved in cell wall biosynthesis
VVIAQTKALIGAGVNTEIATTDADGKGRLVVSYESINQWKGAPVRFFPRQLSESFKYSRPLERWLHAEIRKFDAVHIHAVFSHSSVAASNACMRAGVPYIVRPLGSLDPETYSHKGVRKRIFAMIWGRRMLSRAAAIHYSTTRERALVENSFDLRQGFVAPVGIDIDPARYLKQSSLRNIKNRSREAPYLIFLGRLDPIKQIELLIDAFDTATNDPNLANWRLVIAGDGDPDYVSRLRNRAARLPAQGRIEFVGWLFDEEKTKLLAGAAILALLSKHENFGRSAAEAMSLGVPVLISDDVYLAQDVRAYRAGWVVPGTIEHATQGVRNALMSPRERERLGQGAIRLATEQFGLENSTKLLMDQYARITGL